jgi:hypothetical protein
MSRRERPGTTARNALRLGGLLIVLAGLFGMHGLDSHGVAGMETAASTVMAGPAAAAADHVAGVQEVASVMTAAGVFAPGHQGMGTGMAVLCLAVLAVALVALLRLLRASRVSPVLWMLERPARAPGHPGRGPDPPSLVNLSIQRC